MRRTSAEFPLAQLAAEPSCIVIENSARVWRYAAKSPEELPIADCIWPLAKVPAATCLFLIARSQARRTARARSSGVSAAVGFIQRFIGRYRCLPGTASIFGFLGWLAARESADSAAARSESSSNRFVVERAVRPSATVRMEMVTPCSA